MTDAREGRVTASYGRRYEVTLANGTALECVSRGKRADYACGDLVTVVPLGARDGVIEHAAPRRSLLYRSYARREKLIATNVTQAVIVTAAVPAVDTGFLDRCLVAAESQGIRAMVVLNKIDLPQAALARERLVPYRGLGYPVVELSAARSVAPLAPLVEGQVSVFVGQSGTGKSTLINGLLPAAHARIGEISAARGAGCHTTTHARWYALGTGALVDSPGMQEFGLHHLTAPELGTGFVELRPFLGRCRFNDCRHVEEPGCAVLAAVEDGAIAYPRYASYRALVADLGRAPPTYAKR